VFSQAKARMPTYNGFSVSIYVDGRPLPEYQPQFDGLAKEMTCWIPSQVSKVIHLFPTFSPFVS
jgi:hypothetical protein